MKVPTAETMLSATAIGKPFVDTPKDCRIVNPAGAVNVTVPIATLAGNSSVRNRSLGLLVVKDPQEYGLVAPLAPADLSGLHDVCAYSRIMIPFWLELDELILTVKVPEDIVTTVHQKVATDIAVPFNGKAVILVYEFP